MSPTIPYSLVMMTLAYQFLSNQPVGKGVVFPLRALATKGGQTSQISVYVLVVNAGGEARILAAAEDGSKRLEFWDDVPTDKWKAIGACRHLADQSLGCRLIEQVLRMGEEAAKAAREPDLLSHGQPASIVWGFGTYDMIEVFNPVEVTFRDGKLDDIKPGAYVHVAAPKAA